MFASNVRQATSLFGRDHVVPVSSRGRNKPSHGEAIYHPPVSSMAGKWTIEIGDFANKTSIHRDFPAMFDDTGG